MIRTHTQQLKFPSTVIQPLRTVLCCARVFLSAALVSQVPSEPYFELHVGISHCTSRT
jgi:hypothetical protein